MYHFLKALGHDAVVISPTNWADFLDWMPGIKTVIDFEKKRDAALALINDADYLFCLDFNTLSRTKNMEAPLANAKGARILIDHHQQPQREVFAYGVSDTSKSSTCEMVYDLIMASENGAHISLDVATCLYTGLMTDTGSFRFPSTTASVHKIVAHLKEVGLQHSKIHENIYDQSSEGRLKFMGNAFLNRMHVFLNLRLL